MSNKIIKLLTKERVDRFCNAFTLTKDLFWDVEQKKLRHPGEFGSYRENIVKHMIELFIPQRYGIGNGFVISNSDDISTQCDIIIYDSHTAPLIENEYGQKFYLIESVVGIGEVKSNINSKAELNNYLNKMAKIKMLREKTKNAAPLYSQFKIYDPISNPFDQIFSFIICKRLNFPINETTDIIKYEDNIPQRHWHNLAISIDDGCFLYKTESGSKNLYFPFNGKMLHKHHWLPKDNNDISQHIIFFLSWLYSGIKLTTILNIDLGLYLADNVYDKITYP